MLQGFSGGDLSTRNDGVRGSSPRVGFYDECSACKTGHFSLLLKARGEHITGIDVLCHRVSRAGSKRVRSGVT